MTMRHAPGWLCLLVLSLAAVSSAAAQSVPSALQGWEAWVLHGHEQQACPLLATPGNSDDRECVWPGRLSFDADKTGAKFALQVRVDAESWVALPGGRDAWPQQVRVDNAPAVVLDRNGAPSLRLAAGDHDVVGTMQWNERPARVQVPASVALVDLRVDGVAIAQPARDGDWLTLGQAAARQREADALDVRVFRKLGDGAPPTLETQLKLHVSGSAREQLLGPVLPQGFVATALAGDLPARLDPDGRLRVQLRPGYWTLALDARGIAPLSKLAFKAPAAPWPKQEIWSYADAPALRTTRVTGAQPIDPAQAGVPEDWRGLPAFVMTSGAALAVEQRARGLGANADARLQLDRNLWLDFDGHGLSADDHLTGKLGANDRLDVAAPWVLESAQADSNPLLVTRGAHAGTSGVELRVADSELDLSAGLRRAGRGGAQPATGGWQQTLDDVDATLHLPYGYRLLGAPGADRSPDSWVARWNLLDLFVAAVIALLAWRLLGWRWGLVALTFVALSHGEPGAPRWTPALAVACGLVAAVLPDGKLRKAARAAGIAMLVLAAIATLPFAAVQVRDALHPQLENTGLAWIAPERGQSVAVARTEFMPPPPTATLRAKAQLRAGVAPPPPPPAPPPPQEQSVMSTPAPAAPPPPPADVAPNLQTVVVTGSHISATDIVTSTGYPPDMIVQSGRGVPDWSRYGSAYRLGWSGPVTAQQTYRLVILPAWATRILRIAMLLLLVAWLVAIARAFDLKMRLPGQRGLAAAGAAGLLLAVLVAPQARAQTMPSPELLSQLQARLLEAPKCAPSCVSSPSADVAVQADALQVTLEADAATAVAFPLPYADAPASLRGVSVDGKPAVGLVRRDDSPWIALDRGVHRIALDFQLDADSASIALHFPITPPNVTLAAPGWQVAGNDGVRLLSDTLTFTRERSADQAGDGALPAQAFPPYVTLTRNIAIGLDSRVDTLVTRVAPASGGFTVELPLLPGEHVVSPGLKVERGRVQITFGAGDNEARWSSTLDAGSSLKLEAPALGQRAEVWQVASAPLLHLAFSGVPESGGDGAVHVFRPLPGETLDVAVTRPGALHGSSIAFDAATLDVVRGEHAADSTLTLETRSTRGGEQVIDLPDDAQLLGVQRDGQSLELNLHDGHLALPVQPGSQSFVVRFRETSPLGMLSRTPAISLGAHAANIGASLALPHDRWVLWTFGPRAGPAVLYWSQLVVLLIVAIALARFAPTPLRWWHWLLLGIGFSTFAWAAFVIVAAWLVVLGLRERSTRMDGLNRTPFNIVQVLLAALTVVALLCLVASVPQGLLGQPDMRVAGNGSNAWALHWFADQGNGALPRAGALTLPLWAYKAAMLAWALWLANALIGWLRWGFRAWTRGGYWKPAPPPAKATLAERVATERNDAGT
jgi:hypothetical protein